MTSGGIAFRTHSHGWKPYEPRRARHPAGEPVSGGADHANPWCCPAPWSGRRACRALQRCSYNVSARRRPEASRLRLREAWCKAWDGMEPLVARTHAGETIPLEDLKLVMTRRGDQTWWGFACSPLRGGDAAVAGSQRVVAEGRCLRGISRLADETSGGWLAADWQECGGAMEQSQAAPPGTGQDTSPIEQALPFRLGARTSFELGPGGGAGCRIALPLAANRST